MVRYISSVTVPFPRQRVWALMSDWTNVPSWDLNITKCTLAEGQPPGSIGKGIHYDCLFSSSSMKDIEVDYECVVYDPPHKCSYVGLAKLLRSQDSIACESVDNDTATKITAEFNLDFRGLLSPFSFVMNGAMQKTCPAVMDEIKKFVGKELGEGTQNRLD